MKVVHLNAVDARKFVVPTAFKALKKHATTVANVYAEIAPCSNGAVRKVVTATRKNAKHAWKKENIVIIEHIELMTYYFKTRKNLLYFSR